MRLGCILLLFVLPLSGKATTDVPLLFVHVQDLPHLLIKSEVVLRQSLA